MGKQHRAKRPKRAREDLVVVNPTMVSFGTGGAEKMQLISNNKRKQAPQKFPNHNADKNVCGSKLKKKKKKQEQNKQQQKNKKTIGNKEAVLGVAELVGTEGPSCSVLRVKREADRLAGVYWILLTRNSPRPCVVALPNHYDLTPSQLAAMLRHVGFQAMALHSKMTSKQRKETVQRLKVAESTVVMHAMVVVTTDHLLPSTASTQAQVLLVDGVQAAAFQVATAKFAHVHLVTATDVESRKKLLSDYSSDLTTPCLQQLQTRLKLARQIVDLAQQIEKTGAATQKDDAKWARKLTKGADLWDDDEETGRKITKKRKRALNPEEQRLQALTEKLYVMLARKLPESRSNPSSVSSGGERDVDQGQRSEKLEVLGLVTVKAAVGTAMTDERTSAQTRWMDFAEGCIYGGEWKGAVRHGASKDRTSLALRATFCADKATGSSYMNNWMPNKEPSDIETWGGEFGKACGHNEVVMHQLRPFYPQEVVNSKVCSKFFPAPGNQGFDGCLEHLRLACMAQSTSMTLWDAEYFIFISSRGHVTLSKKSQLLSLSLASLHCLVPALRSWTVANTGHRPVNTNLVAIQLCCRLGYGEKRGELPPKTIKRIISFVLGGSARLWRQIAKVPTPLEEETEYYSTTCN